MSSQQDLISAIAALNNQRELLGDDVVNLAIAPLQAQLDAFRSQGWADFAEQRLKQVSVLFADIVGSTQMARQLDPEETQSILDGALKQLSDIIDRFHGRVLQYAGDSLLAAFGADDAYEEDPENAVRAGLACLEASRQIADDVLHRFGLEGFDLRVGINTGRVLIGGGVDADNSIRGLTVHIAARMEQQAPPGGLRISHYCFRHVRGIFDVTEQPPIDIKGLDEPLKTYLVHSAKPRAFHNLQRGIDGVETQMIGRQVELGHLQQQFQALFDDTVPPAPRVVTIVAEAGIGKSRLLYEFENWADTQPYSYYLFKGRSQPTARQQPYGLLYNILAWRLQLSEGDDIRHTREQFCSRLQPLFSTEEMLSVEMLGQLIGLDFSHNPKLAALLDDPQKIRRRGLHCAAEVLRRLYRSGDPILLIVDDLHWADTDSLNFLDYLLKANNDIPMLLLALARPELYRHRPAWPVCQNTLRIDLQALNHQHSQQLATTLLQRLDMIPSDLLKLVTDSADGNPFYMEELVKMMIDDGAIISDIEQWRLVPQKLDNIQVPDSLTGVLQARLDALNAQQRATLQLASVIGFMFWDNTLATIEPDSLKYLPELVQRELIIQQPGSRFEGAQKYSFQHHILHKVTYLSLLKTHRENFHAAVAGWYESLANKRGSDFPGITAYHYECANNWARAVEFYAQAAQQAAARHSGDATLNYVQRALPHLTPADLKLRWSLLEAREKILSLQHDRKAHEADLDALLETAQQLADEPRIAEAILRRASAICDAGDYQQAEQSAIRAFQRAQACQQSDIAAQAKEIQAMCLRRMGNFPDARQAAENGLTLARLASNPQIEGRLITNLAALCAESGDLAQCFQLDRKYLDIVLNLQDKVGESNAYNTLGDNYLRIGDYDRAEACFEQSISIARSIGYSIGECVVQLNLAIIANLKQRFPNAIELAQQALKIAIQGEFRDLQAATHLQLGQALTETGEFEAAHEALQQAIELFEANSGEHLAMEVFAALARLSLQQGNLTEAHIQVVKVLDFLQQGGSLDGTEEPILIRLTVYQVLQQAGDARAGPFLQQTRQLLQQRADKITDNQLRHAFLNQVPHNRAILQASEQSDTD